MSECLSETLAEVTDRFLIRAGIEKKKMFARYLVLAEECWEDIFKNTLWVIKSVWLPTKAGNPYNYISMPSDCQRLLSVAVDDSCGLIQPLFYNNQINVIVKPTTKKCGCTADCDCGGLCDAVNSTSTTTKLMFTIANVDYYQTCWLQYCPNGDILQWCRTPAKKYNNIAGDPGDYNDDYNRDYDRANPPFSDYTIEYLETQTKICKLEVSETGCGCPVESTANEELFLDCCGFWVNWSCGRKRKCKQFSPNINSNHRGEIKISECGNKIYFIPSYRWKEVTTKETPDYLLANYQSTGTSVGAETLVPKYSRNLMYAALDNGRKEYNSAYSIFDKQQAMYKLTDERNRVTAFLNPIDLIELAKVQDIAQRW